MSQGFSVAVFAHKEASEIEASLDALRASGLGASDPIHVIVNGSTDGTDAVVKRIAADDPRVHAHILAFGDKSNAWNHYVHRIADTARDHIFLDGDVRPAADSLTAIAKTLEAFPAALAVSSLPRGGRKSVSWARDIVAHHGMPGNLYALRRTTVERMRRQTFFLPVGLVGDDTFLRWILVRDLDASVVPDIARVQPAVEAFFEYESFPIFDVDGLTAIYKRQKRYSRRDLEMELLLDVLTEKGLSALPRYISELYPHARPSTALKGTKRPRQIFFLASYVFAKRNAGKIPQGDPWSAVFAGRA